MAQFRPPCGLAAPACDMPVVVTAGLCDPARALSPVNQRGITDTFASMPSRAAVLRVAAGARMAGDASTLEGAARAVSAGNRPHTAPNLLPYRP